MALNERNIINVHIENKDLKYIEIKDIILNKYYFDAEKELKIRGYNNIKFEEIKDLKLGLKFKDDRVTEIRIDDKQVISDNNWVTRDSKINLIYHSFK